MYNRNIFFLIIFFALIATSSQGSDELLDLFGLDVMSQMVKYI